MSDQEPSTNQDNRPPALAGDAGSGYIFDHTPVSHVLNTLNRRCVEAGKRKDFDEAKRIAVIAGYLEDAITEFYGPNIRHEPRPTE